MATSPVHSISISVIGTVETRRRGRPRIDSRLSGIGEVIREMGDLYGICMTKMIPAGGQYIDQSHKVSAELTI
jgi:hypothetical protein